MTRAYIALGSNLRDPLEQVQRALLALESLPATTLIATSSFYRTPPYGPQDQPDFLNAVVAIDTQLTALELLTHTQRIELEQGRERKDERWGPRTLDLDILLYGHQHHSTPRLTLPHYDMHNRAFMLLPLAEIDPDIVVKEGKSAQQLLAQLDTEQIRRW
jgi:2-amino-4-hydroxy-6-hydroxymethyldihydropteridine diphosphokinase